MSRFQVPSLEVIGFLTNNGTNSEEYFNILPIGILSWTILSELIYQIPRFYVMLFEVVHDTKKNDIRKFVFIVKRTSKSYPYTKHQDSRLQRWKLSIMPNEKHDFRKIAFYQKPRSQDLSKLQNYWLCCLKLSSMPNNNPISALSFFLSGTAVPIVFHISNFQILYYAVWNCR